MAGRVSFPLNHLKPGEAVVYPLSISLVPVLEARSMFPGSAELVREHWQQDRLYDLGATIMSTVGQQTINLRPSYELKRVTFRVEDEPSVIEESREISARERIQISNACECGSCPLLLMRARGGSWIRAREILTYANSPAASQTFDLSLPDGIDEVMITENPGETAFIWNVTIAVASPGGQVTVHRIVNEGTVTVDKTFLIDLGPYRRSGSSLRIRGEGYYVAKTDVICPFVFPLPDRWIQIVAAKETALPHP